MAFQQVDQVDVWSGSQPYQLFFIIGVIDDFLFCIRDLLNCCSFFGLECTFGIDSSDVIFRIYNVDGIDMLFVCNLSHELLMLFFFFFSLECLVFG